MSNRSAGLDLGEAGEALALLLRTHRVLVEEIDRALRDQIGLTFAMWEVLVVLSAAEGGSLRMVDVTRRMCVSKSNITQLIDKLEGSRLVRRDRSLHDRRSTFATLTRQGWAAARRGGKTFNALAKERFARQVSQREIAGISSGLTKVLSAHDAESAGP